MDSPLGNVELVATTLYVADLDAAITWYRDTLGLVPTFEGSDEHRYASYAIGGGIVVLEPREAALEPMPPGSESTTINVMVDRDPSDVHADLVARGAGCGKVYVSPGYASFLLRDPDGNRFYVTRPHTQ